MAAESKLRAAIGTLVREQRAEQGWTQLELAGRAGLPGQNWQISRLEGGRWTEERMWMVIARVAAALGTTEPALLGRARDQVGAGLDPDELQWLQERLGPAPQPAVSPKPSAARAQAPAAAARRPPSTPKPKAPAEERSPEPAPPVAPPPPRRPAGPELSPEMRDEVLERCISFAETHLLGRLEEASEELDPMDVHALAATLHLLEEVKTRRLERPKLQRG